MSNVEMKLTLQACLMSVYFAIFVLLFLEIWKDFDIQLFLENQKKAVTYWFTDKCNNTAYRQDEYHNASAHKWILSSMQNEIFMKRCVHNQTLIIQTAQSCYQFLLFSRQIVKLHKKIHIWGVRCQCFSTNISSITEEHLYRNRLIQYTVQQYMCSKNHFITLKQSFDKVIQ